MRRSRLLFALLLGLAACGDDGARGEGDTCHFSADCDVGLFCDLQATPPVCVKAGGPRDFSAAPVDASIDMSALD